MTTLITRNPLDPRLALYASYKQHFEILVKQLGQVAKDREISGEALRVLLYLYSTLTFGQTSPLNKEEIARKLDMRGQNVSRAFRLLEEKGIIHQTKIFKNHKLVALNPDYPTDPKLNRT